jgi:hypothetical protein
MLQSKPNTSNGNHGESDNLELDMPAILASIDKKSHSDEGSLFDKSEGQSKYSDEDSLFDRSETQNNHPDESLSDSEDVGMDESERDYAAFRTTTTFLHIIQRWPNLRRSYIQEQKPSPVRNDRLVLKLCNAFAILSVIRHEVVAVGVDFHLDKASVDDSPVELLLTQQGLRNFDILVNGNPRLIHCTALRKLDGDKVCSPDPPAALGKDPTPKDLENYIKDLRLTR